MGASGVAIVLDLVCPFAPDLRWWDNTAAIGISTTLCHSDSTPMLLKSLGNVRWAYLVSIMGIQYCIHALHISGDAPIGLPASPIHLYLIDKNVSGSV